MIEVFFAALPFLGLLATCLAFFPINGEHRSPFITIVKGSTVWSCVVWVETNILSIFDAINGTAITTFWSCYVALAVYILCKKRPNCNRLYWLQSLKEMPVIWVICVCTFIVALAYPPNNWDVMTYHMPRVEHWIQNHNLAAYPTSIERQIGLPPFNSMIVLQSYAPGFCDLFLNLVQWFGFVGTILGVMDITARLGGNRKAQTLAALFIATLPIAIMGASNTESSTLVTFWLCACMSLYLSWREEATWQKMLLFGLSLGFAIHSKGTAAPIALPLVLMIAWHSLRHPRKYFVHGLLAAVLILVINVPHFARTYVAYGTPLSGGAHSIILKPKLGVFVTNVLYNFFLNESLFVTDGRAEFWGDFVRKHITNDKDTTYFPLGSIENIRRNYAPTDADGQNPLHAILVLGLPLLLFMRLGYIHKKYLWLILASFGCYSLLLTWMPMNGRYHIPLFAFAAAPYGLLLSRTTTAYVRNIANAGLCLGAVMPLLFCLERPLGPLAPILPYRSDIMHFLQHPREELLFNARANLLPQFKQATNFLSAKNQPVIGIRFGNNGWEYPFWVLLRSRASAMPLIKYANDEKDKTPEYIFVQENFVWQPMAQPVVLHKQEDNSYIKIENFTPTR